MDNLTLRVEHKKLPRQQVVQNDRFDSIGTEELLELFPLSRYFQIHFTHVHENCGHAQRQLDELKQSINRVEQKLDRLLAAMMQEQL